MDEAENLSNDLGHKEAKNNQLEQQEKRIQKMRVEAASVTTSNTFILWGCQREKTEGKKLETYLKKMTENFPNL